MDSSTFYGDNATARGAWKKKLAQIAATGACATLAACQSPGIVGAPSGTVVGRVRGAGTESAPLVVVAIDRDSGRIAQRAFLEHGTYYALPMTAGRYKLYAFADLDRNGTRGVGEPTSLVYSIADDVRAGDRIELPALELKASPR